MTHYPKLTTLVVAVAGVATFTAAGNASAAVIAAHQAGRITDSNGDDIGEGVNFGTAALLVGDNSGSDGGNSTNEYRVGYAFDVAGNLAALTEAVSITFSTTITDKRNAAPDFQLVALTEGETGDVTAADYANAGTIVATFSADDYNTNDVLTVDVTSFLKADLGQGFTEFRLEAINAAAYPNANPDADLFFFGTGDTSDAALITVVPEPASFALLAAGALLGLRRRR